MNYLHREMRPARDHRGLNGIADLLVYIRNYDTRLEQDTTDTTTLFHNDTDCSNMEHSEQNKKRAKRRKKQERVTLAK